MKGPSQDIRSGFRRLGQSSGVTSTARILRSLPAPLAAPVDPVVVFESE